MVGKRLDIVQLEIPEGDDSITSAHYAVRRYTFQSDGAEEGKMARVRTGGVAGTGYVFLCSFSLCLCLLHFLFISLYLSLFVNLCTN